MASAIKYQRLSSKSPTINHYRRNTVSKSASRRRSRSFNLDDSHDLHTEITPLLLTARLNELLRAPLDHGKKVCLTFLYIGVCTMLPWNFLISISAFWNYKFRQVNGTTVVINQTTDSFAHQFPFLPVPVPIIKPTDMQVSFPSYLAIASNIPGAITTILHSSCGQRVSVSTRIGWSLTLLFVSFAILLALSIPDCDLWQERFLHLVLMLVVLANVGVNVLQGSMFGISGRFPPVYAGAVMMGQALGGVVPSIAAIALLSFDVEAKILGPACFGAVLILLFLAFLSFQWVKVNKFFLYYAEGKDNHGVVEDHDAQVDDLCYKDIFKRSWTYLISGFLTYATTLSVFPALTNSVESMTKSEWTNKFFTPVAVVLLFNLSDLSGRTLATLLQWPKINNLGRYGVLAVSFMRAAFIPLLMFCNANPQERHLPVLIHSDYIFCFLTSLMGISVGYFGNHCLTNAPKTSDDPESQEATSLILTALFVLGQASGSFLSYFVLRAL